MSVSVTLRLVLSALNNADVPYMLVGSFASMMHGEERLTKDIDFVIDPTPATLAIFEASFDPDAVYVGPSPQEALARRDQFNIIDTTSGWKVDLIIRKDRPFSKSEFERRAETALLGMTVQVATPEDTILSKLEWASMSGSDRQVADAAGVLAVSAPLDDDYLDRWAAELGVTDLLERARSA